LDEPVRASLDVVGKTLQIDGFSFQLIGVMLATFQFPARDQQFWAPITTSHFWGDPALKLRICMCSSMRCRRDVMESSFVGWNSLQAAIPFPWFRNGAYLGKKMWSETQMDLREYQLNVCLIRTAWRFSFSPELAMLLNT